MRSARTLLAGGTATAVGAATRAVLREGPAQGAPRWTRTNHRGAPISLLEGPAVAAGVLAGSAAQGGRGAAAAMIATAGGAAFGLVDDLTEDPSRTAKGLRGHLSALARGEVTTGGLKVLGIGATSLVAGAVLTGRPGPGGRDRTLWAVDVATTGALIATAANLVNLLDLRPGRALKATAVTGAVLAPTAGGPVAAAALGAAAAALPGDLAEEDMLGDGGANAVGAALGVAAALAAPRPVRLALLAGQVALTLASERVSFTAVIARTPGLRHLDAWGRRP